MLIKSDDLARHLAASKANGSLAPLWVIVGEEALLALEAGDARRACAKEMGYTERCVLAFGATSDWSPLMDALMSVSLFDDKKIIELRFMSAGPGVKGAKVLAEFANMAPTAEGIVSIVHLTQVDYTTKKASWYKALTANANVINCEPISRAAYPRWIQNRLKNQNQSMSADALNFFAEQTEGNLLAAKQELMKLSLLYPARELTLKEVEDCVMNVSRYSLDDLIEAIALGDGARVTRTVTGMQAEGEALPLIMMRLTSFIRDVMTVLMQRKAGMRPAGFMRPGVGQAAARLNLEKTANALARCADIDRLSKGLNVPTRNDVWSELKALCLFLAH